MSTPKKATKNVFFRPQQIQHLQKSKSETTSNEQTFIDENSESSTPSNEPSSIEVKNVSSELQIDLSSLKCVIIHVVTVTLDHQQKFLFKKQADIHELDLFVHSLHDPQSVCSQIFHSKQRKNKSNQQMSSSTNCNSNRDSSLNTDNVLNCNVNNFNNQINQLNGIDTINIIHSECSSYSNSSYNTNTSNSHNSYNSPSFQNNSIGRIDRWDIKDNGYSYSKQTKDNQISPNSSLYSLTPNSSTTISTGTQSPRFSSKHDSISSSPVLNTPPKTCGFHSHLYSHLNINYSSQLKEQQLNTSSTNSSNSNESNENIPFNNQNTSLTDKIKDENTLNDIQSTPVKSQRSLTEKITNRITNNLRIQQLSDNLDDDSMRLDSPLLLKERKTTKIKTQIQQERKYFDDTMIPISSYSTTERSTTSLLSMDSIKDTRQSPTFEMTHLEHLSRNNKLNQSNQIDHSKTQRIETNDTENDIEDSVFNIPYYPSTKTQPFVHDIYTNDNDTFHKERNNSSYNTFNNTTSMDRQPTQTLTRGHTTIGTSSQDQDNINNINNSFSQSIQIKSQSQVKEIKSYTPPFDLEKLINQRDEWEKQLPELPKPGDTYPLRDVALKQYLSEILTLNDILEVNYIYEWFIGRKDRNPFMSLRHNQMSGIVLKKSYIFGTWTEKYVIIKNNILIYFASEKCVQRLEYPSNVLDLSNSTFKVEEENLLVIELSNKEVYIFKVEKDKLNEWIFALNHAVMKKKKKIKRKMSDQTFLGQNQSILSQNEDVDNGNNNSINNNTNVNTSSSSNTTNIVPMISFTHIKSDRFSRTQSPSTPHNLSQCSTPHQERHSHHSQSFQSSTCLQNSSNTQSLKTNSQNNQPNDSEDQHILNKFYSLRDDARKISLFYEQFPDKTSEQIRLYSTFKQLERISYDDIVLKTFMDKNIQILKEYISNNPNETLVFWYYQQLNEFLSSSIVHNKVLETYEQPFFQPRSRNSSSSGRRVQSSGLSPLNSPRNTPNYSTHQKTIMCRMCEREIKLDILTKHTFYCKMCFNLCINESSCKDKLKILIKQLRKQKIVQNGGMNYDGLIQYTEDISTITTVDEKSLEEMEKIVKLIDMITTQSVDVCLTAFSGMISRVVKHRIAVMKNYISSHTSDLWCSISLWDGNTQLDESDKDSVSLKDFNVISKFSSGAYSRLYLVSKKTTGDFYAMKVSKKADMIRKNVIDGVLAEKQILQQSINKSVVQLYYAFQDNNSLFLVMEYCPGGDLGCLIQNIGYLEERVVKIYSAEIVIALEHIHRMGCIHRDLKPDNVLIDKNGHLKLTDFGLSVVGCKNEKNSYFDNRLLCTPDYVAPEVIVDSLYSNVSDYFSLGCMIYEMLIGIPPFNDITPELIFKRIRTNDYHWPDNCVHHHNNDNEEELMNEFDLDDDVIHISDEAYSIVNSFLCVDEKKRLGARGSEEVKSHPFFNGIRWKTLLSEPRVDVFVPDLDGKDDTGYFSREMKSMSPIIDESGETIVNYDCTSIKTLAEKNMIVLEEEVENEENGERDDGYCSESSQTESESDSPSLELQSDF